ncbi:hypothetical protein [Pyrofollis japonicus]|uniref:hypothetical protein n=1 Tax=Pyrofollis japonicus TaxID=3060460 RepID=UPI00295A927B|nr:hypothetical protein [Pyrofollis japonicus]
MFHRVSAIALRGLRVRFYTTGLPVSVTRALSMGAELVDSVALRHDVARVEVGPSWWSRRICALLGYAECVQAVEKSTTMAVVVDSEVPRGLRADLVYQLDSRKGSVLHVAGEKAVGH